MSGGTVIGSPASYREMIELFRARKEALGLSDLSIDRYVDWAIGYTQKVLGPSQVKRLSGLTMFDMIGALGLSVTFVHDQAAVDNIRRKEERREERRVRGGDAWPLSMKILERAKPAIMREYQHRSVSARLTKLDPLKRKQIARRAARIRWQRVRAARRRRRNSPGS